MLASDGDSSSNNSCGPSLKKMKLDNLSSLKIDGMKLEKDPISAQPGIEELMDCFDLFSVEDEVFVSGNFRQKETDNKLLLWFDMPGLSLPDVFISIIDKTSMTIKGEELLSIEYVDSCSKNDRRFRTYGGMLRFPENHFDLVAAHVGVEMKNGVLKLVVPKLKPTHQPPQETPKTEKQKLEEEAVLASVKQVLEEESSDLLHVNVE